MIETSLVSARTGRHPLASTGNRSAHIGTYIGRWYETSGCADGIDVCATKALWNGEMIWEWEHQSTGGQWLLTVGVWRAAVQRVAGMRPLWQATLGGRSRRTIGM